MITTSQAAEIMGTSMGAVVSMIHRGQLKTAQKFALPGTSIKVWHIDEAEVRQYTKSAKAPDGYLTTDETAELIGVSKKVLYQMVRRGKIPGVVRLKDRTFAIPRSPGLDKVIASHKGAIPAGFVTSRDAAEALGTSMYIVTERCRDGTVAGAIRVTIKGNEVWAIPESEIELLKHRKNGRPRSPTRILIERELAKSPAKPSEVAKRVGITHQLLNYYMKKMREENEQGAAP